MNLRESDSGGRGAARTGDDIVVELPENPSTGYRWQPAVDPEALEVTGDSYHASTGRVGAPGVRRLTFRVRSAGPARLRIEKRRSWEPAAVAEFGFDLAVDPGPDETR